MPLSVARLPSRHVLALAAVTALAGCTEKAEGVQLEPQDVIPAAADIVVGIELGNLINSPLFAPFGAMVATDPELQPIIASWKACELNTTQLHMTVATTVASDGEDMLIFVESPGIGTPEAMKCLEREFATASGEAAGFIHFTKRGKVQAAPEQDGALTILANDHQLIHASANWQKEALDRANGDAERTHSKAAEAEARLGHPGDVYFVVMADDDVRKGLEDVPEIDKLVDISGKIKLGEGADMELNAHFSDPNTAGTLKGMVDPIVAEGKGEAVAAGVPKGVVDSFATEATEGTLTMKLSIGKDDVGAVMAMMGSM
jgi:hypothetical protein